jgi:hypothetical protein
MLLGFKFISKVHLVRTFKVKIAHCQLQVLQNYQYYLFDTF